MISQRVATSSRIGWTDVIPGRLLHLRIHLDKRSEDILGFYQHAQSHAKDNLELRERFSQDMSNFLDFLGQLPPRSTLYIAEDANCSLPHSPPHLGTGEFHWPGRGTVGTQHPDLIHLLALLQRHHVCALTSWMPHRGLTYKHGAHASRIDLFLCRLPVSDAISRDVKDLTQAECSSSQ